MPGYDDFWSKAAPGLLDLGLGAITRNQAQQEAASKLGTAQGPLYQASTNAAKGMLDQLGTADPQAFAKQRFDAQQALVSPVYDKQFDDLYRNLYAKGQLGTANYNPGVAGITPNGTAMNPQLAAFFAAKNAQQSKDAYSSMGEGQKYIDSLVNRAGMLQRTAGSTQNTGLEAQRTQPSRAAGNSELLRGVSGVLKNAGGLGALPGALRSPNDAPDMDRMGGLPDFNSDDYATNDALDMSQVGGLPNFNDGVDYGSPTSAAARTASISIFRISIFRNTSAPAAGSTSAAGSKELTWQRECSPASLSRSTTTSRRNRTTTTAA
jgi:hypothetical protein